MYDYILEVIGAFLRYGASPTALVLSGLALFRTRRVKRLISRHFPWLFRDDSDVLNYKDRQMRIEEKVDAIARHLGVETCGALEIGTSGRMNSKALSNSLPGAISPEKPFERMIKMNKFKSRKFWMAVVAAILVILNDGLDLGVDSDTVLAFAGLVASWIIGESAVDAKRAGNNVVSPEEETYH